MGWGWSIGIPGNTLGLSVSLGLLIPFAVYYDCSVGLQTRLVGGYLGYSIPGSYADETLVVHFDIAGNHLFGVLVSVVGMVQWVDVLGDRGGCIVSR